MSFQPIIPSRADLCRCPRPLHRRRRRIAALVKFGTRAFTATVWLCSGRGVSGGAEAASRSVRTTSVKERHRASQLPSHRQRKTALCGASLRKRPALTELSGPPQMHADLYYLQVRTPRMPYKGQKATKAVRSGTTPIKPTQRIGPCKIAIREKSPSATTILMPRSTEPTFLFTENPSFYRAYRGDLLLSATKVTKPAVALRIRVKPGD